MLSVPYLVNNYGRVHHVWNAEKDDYFELHMNLHKLFFINRMEIVLHSPNATSLHVYRVNENILTGDLFQRSIRRVGGGTLVGAGELALHGGYEGFAAVKVKVASPSTLASVRFLTVQTPRCVSEGAFVEVGEKRRVACENGRPGVVEETCVQRGDALAWNETTSYCSRREKRSRM